MHMGMHGKGIGTMAGKVKKRQDGTKTLCLNGWSVVNNGGKCYYDTLVRSSSLHCLRAGSRTLFDHQLLELLLSLHTGWMEGASGETNGETAIYKRQFMV